MTEYGNIFDYQQTAMVFEAITLGFMAAYGLAIIWIVARPTKRSPSSLKPA